MTIGILPAAGNATRIQGLPKFLLPIGDSFLIKRHIDAMEKLAINVFIGTNDVTGEYLRPQHIPSWGVFEYDTMTQTVLSLLEVIIRQHQQDENCLFGLADSYIEDDQCYAKLAAALADCDVAVGVFETRRNQRDKLGMVQVHHETGKIIHVVDKPSQDTALTQAWGALAWRPSFWQHLTPDMPHVGYALMPAIEAGLDVRAVVMEGNYWDCGTFDEYAELIKAIT